MTTPTNTPTPRTDEAQKEYAYVGNKGAVSSKFARLLERENQQLQRERDEAKEQINTWATRSEAHRQAKELVSQVLGNVQTERNYFKQLAEEWEKMAIELAETGACSCEMTNLNEEGEIMWGGSRVTKECDFCKAKTHFHSLQQQKKDEKV